jgi:hypothetical protein
MFSIDGSFIASAWFDARAEAPRGVTVGPCRYDDPAEEPPLKDPGGESAGTIVVQVHTPDALNTLQLEWSAKDARYPMEYFERPGALRADEPRQPIRIRASGGSVPTFTTFVESAENVDFREPREELEIGSSTGDIKIEWTPKAANDDVFVSLDLLEASVYCHFDAQPGEGSIPRALVEKARKHYEASKAITPCTGTRCTSIFLASVRRAKTVSGEHDILVSHAVATMRAVKIVP